MMKFRGLHGTLWRMTYISKILITYRAGSRFIPDQSIRRNSENIFQVEYSWIFVRDLVRFLKIMRGL
jgi:hypothetical protein